MDVECRERRGWVHGDQVRVLDFDDQDADDLIAVNQFSITENHSIRKPVMVLLVNGLPLATIELGNPTYEDATNWLAWNQKAKLTSPSYPRSTP